MKFISSCRPATLLRVNSFPGVFSRILNKYLPNYFYEYLFLRRYFFWEHLQWLYKTVVGAGFALDLIYPVMLYLYYSCNTIPMNHICILTFMTFHLHKDVIHHQANKNCCTYFSIDNVCNKVFENRRK